MILLKSPDEIKKMRAAGRIVYRTLSAMEGAIAPGKSTTYDLEEAAIRVITESGASSAFLGYAPYGHSPFPAWTCISVNDEVVHGIAGHRVLQEGDIVSCDVGVNLNGYFGDSAWTFPVGNIDAETARLLKVTREALYKAIEKAQYGKRLGDVSAAVQQHARKNGYSVVRELVGHGVGRSLHEDPQVPNYGQAGQGVVMKEGMTIAIEPMVNQGHHDIESLSDEWTIVTRDHKLSAHFEHSVAITRDGPLILTEGE